MTPPPIMAAHRKLSFPLVLETMARYQEESTDREALDRRRVLERMQADFETTEEELFLRGFDRAYRLIVEGV